MLWVSSGPSTSYQLNVRYRGDSGRSVRIFGDRNLNDLYCDEAVVQFAANPTLLTAANGQKPLPIFSCGKMFRMSNSANSRLEYIYVWDFVVSKSSVLEFEKCYGPNGEWAKLFRRNAGYLKTELIKDKTDPQRYLTIDYWQSEKHYADFLAKYKFEYDELDRKFEALTVQETKIGVFSTVG